MTAPLRIISNHASAMLERDVDNLANCFGRYAPEILDTQYGKEIWALYQSGKLTPDSELTGQFKQSDKPVDVDGVMRAVDDALKEEAARQRYKLEMAQ